MNSTAHSASQRRGFALGLLGVVIFAITAIIALTIKNAMMRNVVEA